MSLFKIKHEYVLKLLEDAEFIGKYNRLYYVIQKLDYKGEKIAVAIPLRSNINKNFQKNPDEFLPTPPSNTTQTQKGNIAGWHITKMIPINFAAVIKVKKLNTDLQIAEDIISRYNKQNFIDKVKQVLKRIENGEKVFGAIDFDMARQKLDEIQEKEDKRRKAAELKAKLELKTGRPMKDLQEEVRKFHGRTDKGRSQGDEHDR